MKNKIGSEAQKAREYAFLLLKFRLRSEKELSLRLRQKKFSENTIRQVLGFLKQKGFIDDEMFARTWMESCIRRRYGLRRIRHELGLKGVDKGVIDRQIEAIKGSYQEARTVMEVAEERFDRLKGIDPVKARQRVYAYLARRGFAPDTIMETLDQLCRPAS